MKWSSPSFLEIEFDRKRRKQIVGLQATPAVRFSAGSELNVLLGAAD
jgi:hypothetical protein